MFAALRKLLTSWFGPHAETQAHTLEAENAEILRSTASMEEIHPETLETASSHAVPYDENLLERARTQWQFGDWESLAKIDRDTLQHHPDRAKLALLAAAGKLQTDNNNDAKQFIRLAQDWGINKKLISQILTAGVHNSLGRVAALGNQQQRALQHFESAITIGTPGSDAKLLTQARTGEQLNQLGLQAPNSLLAQSTEKPAKITYRHSEPWIEKNDYSHYRKDLEIFYKKKTGKELNLDNPVTFNEKVQWLKLFDSTPLKSRLADKYLVRAWVEEKIGEQYLIPLLGVWDKFEDIDFSQLPNQFVLKANHGYNWNIIVKNKEQMNIEDSQRKFNKWLNTNFAFFGFEMHYANIRPRIIAEHYISETEEMLYDYKVYCFDGNAKFVLVCINRQKDLSFALYNKNWEKQPFIFPGKMHNGEIKKPGKLNELITAAEKLSQGFKLARVDFYILSTGIKFGEITFTPSSGCAKFQPEEYDAIFGELINLRSIRKSNTSYLTA